MSEIDVTKLPAEERVRKVLARVHDEYFGTLTNCARTGDPVDRQHPLAAMIAREEELEMEALAASVEMAESVFGLGEIPAPMKAAIEELVSEIWEKMASEWLKWFFLIEAPDPLLATLRLFALAKHKQPRLIWNMSFRDLGELFGEKGATTHERSRTLFGAVLTDWSKTESACAAMKAAQNGNTCRRGGKKAAPRSH